jgi:chromosome segregation ATPase
VSTDPELEYPSPNPLACFSDSIRPPRSLRPSIRVPPPAPVSPTLDQPSSAQQADQIEKLEAALAQATSTETSLKQEIERLKAALEEATSTESRLKDDIETLKTTLTHSLASEQEMRASVRTTREDWERAEKELRQESRALVDELGKTNKELKRVHRELKGKRLVPFMRRLLQERGRIVEAIPQESTPPDTATREEVQADKE